MSNSRNSNGIAELPPVPHWLVGLWRRESLRFDDGARDDTTRVFWGQTKSLYVDIRVPIDRPEAKGRKALGEFTPTELRMLAQQKGFAGHIEVEGDRCSWIRYLDYHPSTGRPDEGRLRLEGDVLVEEGDPTSALGKSYQEIYRRESNGASLCVALRQSATASPQSNGGSILVLIDDWFLYANARPVELPQAESLLQLLEHSAGNPAKMHDYFNCEISMGRIQGASLPWRVDLSTLPCREGARLFESQSVTVEDGHIRLAKPNEKEASSWKIVESSLPLENLLSLFNR